MLHEPCQFVVSNEVPDHPCVSPSSNCVFERRLIEKYIAENGTDPISGEQLSEEQLIDIKGNLRHIKVTYFTEEDFSTYLVSTFVTSLCKTV